MKTLGAESAREFFYEAGKMAQYSSIPGPWLGAG